MSMIFKACLTAVIAGFAVIGAVWAEDLESARYDDLAMFVDVGVIKSEAMWRFFAKEAADAGVLKIRAMQDHEKARKKKHKAQTGCGRALWKTKEVVINADRASCINLANLAHEIAHIPARLQGCRGHGELFYEFNEAIAQRFEAAFPGEKWGRGYPVAKVRKRAGEYRSPC